MLTRRLEPEVMDTPQDASDYDTMDHSTVNRVFTDDLLEFWRTTPQAAQRIDLATPVMILDVGTGTALIPIHLCRVFQNRPCISPLLKGGPGGVAPIRSPTPINPTPHFHITAIDLATEMLRLAEQHIARERLNEFIRVERVDAKSLPYADGAFDIVMSNSIVHHIPEPLAVLTEMSRVLRPGGTLFVRDLLRPQTAAEVEHFVSRYAGAENAHSQQLFRDSLHAALSLDEVRDLARRTGILDETVRQTSDRHWTLAWHRGLSECKSRNDSPT